MKIYYHLNPEGFSNTYVIANEKTKDVIIIDPGAMNEEIIEQIEANEFKLTSVLITHNHGSHVNGLKTLLKIYSPRIYGADWGIAGKDTTVLNGDGKLRLAGMTVHYMTLPGHTADSMIYKIGTVLFTGDSITAGRIGSTDSSYSSHILRQNINERIFSQQENTIIMPGHGPPSSVGAEKYCNMDLNGTMPNNLTRPIGFY
ncbi:MAG: MBL fold metallo-hydrolase [Treponema sp.]